MSEDPSKRNYVNNTPYPLNNNQFNPAQSQNQNQQNNEFNNLKIIHQLILLMFKILAMLIIII